MNSSLKDGLRVIVRDYGKRVFEEPERLEALLGDLDAGSQTERLAVVAAARLGLVELLRARQTAGEPVAVGDITTRLPDTVKPEERLAAINACAYALGIRVQTGRGSSVADVGTAAELQAKQPFKGSTAGSPNPKRKLTAISLAIAAVVLPLYLAGNSYTRYLGIKDSTACQLPAIATSSDSLRECSFPIRDFWVAGLLLFGGLGMARKLYAGSNIL
jgi:hypothetical protein